MDDKRVNWRRARARRAAKVLERVRVQERQLADALGRATDAGARLGAVVAVLRAAAAPGRHQPNQAAADAAVERVADVARDALVQLLGVQEAAAQKVLATEERRREHAGS